MVFTIILSIIGIYFLFNIGLIIIWIAHSDYKSETKKHSDLPFISVIIPVRNEAENILFLLEDLEKQTYQKDKFEVIIADDDSTDDTLKIIKQFQKNTSINLIINQLPSKENNASPKKRAIDSSIKLAKGTLITTTDGDCRVGEKWLETIANFQAETGAVLISGAVCFSVEYRMKNDECRMIGISHFYSLIHSFNIHCGTHSLIQKIQTIEFASLVGSGACAMLFGKPNMCNGANLTYLKSVFYEVNGFSGNEDLASGDDEFLMHKIARLYPEKVQFLKNQHTIVETQAHQTWQSFYNQRKRWASKWKHYQDWKISALAIFIFLSNFCWLLAVSCWLLAYFSFSQICLISLIKFSAEFIFLSLILFFLKKRKLTILIPLVQLIYPFYVVFFGLISQRKGKYFWKGRELE